MVTEACAGGGVVEAGKAMPVADSPRRDVVDSGLSTLLGGWSGGTLASTLLKIADFCPLSRGLALRVAGGTAEAAPRTLRRSARRQPAASLPPRDAPRPAADPRAFPMPRCRCNSETSSGPTKRNVFGIGDKPIRRAYVTLAVSSRARRRRRRGRPSSRRRRRWRGLPPPASGAGRAAAKADRSDPARGRRRSSSAPPGISHRA